MTQTETVERNDEPLSFEKVWEMFQESGRDFDRRMAETDREFQESRRDFDRRLQESSRDFDRWLQESRREFDRRLQESSRDFDRRMAKTDRQMEETDRKISRLGNRLGELIEHLTASNLVEKVNELGYRFDHISRNHEIKDEQNKVKAEIDILLEDGDYAMAVEVKTNLTKTAVKEHLRRMDTLRRHADAHGDKRIYVSSVAGALIGDGAREYALEQGLYVIEHPGQTIEILAPPKRREW